MPLDKTLVVMFTAAVVLLTVIDKDSVAVSLFASVTLTDIEEEPDALGVPEMTPEALNINPVGNFPDANVHV